MLVSLVKWDKAFEREEEKLFQSLNSALLHPSPEISFLFRKKIEREITKRKRKEK